ncbi:hypothetical protein VNO77_23458 [Canavalia gladiata]|uniref:Uncharacterized protein n=1 Tax=Canavalia gladiata TaxID=3824 RepID=A0AAN9L9P7_CANGL
MYSKIALGTCCTTLFLEHCREWKGGHHRFESGHNWFPQAISLARAISLSHVLHVGWMQPNLVFSIGCEVVAVKSEPRASPCRIGPRSN